MAQAEVTTIKEIAQHPNADRLNLLRVHGWWIISSCKEDGTSRYDVGDRVVYIPVDSLLDSKFIEYFFRNSKIKPDGPLEHRVRSVKIRQVLSQGIILSLNDEEVLELYPKLAAAKVGDDVSSILNIKKYEPPAKSLPKGMNVVQTAKRHPDFKEYTDLDNYKRYPDVFAEGEEVVFSIKIHGSNVRIAVLSRYPLNWFEKVLKFFHLLPKWEYIIGSRRVQINRRKNYKGFYGEDIYTKAVLKSGLLNKLEPGMQLIGELCGPGIQKNFDYGLTEHKILAFDIIKDGVYIDYDEFVSFCEEKGIERVPEVYRGPFSQEMVEKHRNDNSHPLDKTVPCREGVVIRPAKERNSPFIGRVILKAISDDYYMLKDVSDFH